MLKLIHNHKNNTNKVNKHPEVEKQLQQKESLLKQYCNQIQYLNKKNKELEEKLISWKELNNKLFSKKEEIETLNKKNKDLKKNMKKRKTTIKASKIK